MKKCILFSFFFFNFLVALSQINIDSILDAGIAKDRPGGAESAIKAAISILENKSSTNIQKIRAYHLLNNAYFITGESQKALKSAMVAKDLAIKVKNIDYTALSLSLIAQNYRQLCLNDQALDYYHQVLRLLPKLDKTKKETIFLAAATAYEMGNVEYAQENDKESIAYYNKAVELLQDVPVEYRSNQRFNYLLSNSYMAMGRSYLAQHDYDSTHICYDKARDIIYPVKDKVVQVYLLKCYGELSYAVGKYKNVIDSVGKAEKIIFFDGFGLRGELYELLARSYAKLNDHPNSGKYYDLLKKNQKKRDSELNNATSVAFTDSKKEMLTIIDQKDRWGMGLTIVLSIITISALVVVLMLRKRARRNREMYQKIIDKIEEEKNQKIQIVASKLKNPKSPTSITEEKEKEILEKLLDFENSLNILSKNLTIASLASQLNTNTTYLSEIINRHKDKNFSSYINELKIDYIIDKIRKDSKYHNYKIAYLAEECGLPYSSFVSIFKEYTGMTPSVFLKQSMIQSNSNEQS